MAKSGQRNEQTHVLLDFKLKKSKTRFMHTLSPEKIDSVKKRSYHACFKSNGAWIILLVKSRH